ncbi:MAG: ABC-type transporter, integral rane subunit [Nocardioides sp.]|nr:ABC-type transporter, integral rane subunit [Nocardioides sp.]
MTATDTKTPDAAPESRTGAHLLQALGSKYGLILVWAAMALTFTILAPGRFLTSQNMGNIFGSQAVLVVVAMGLLFAVVAGEWDLSVGATLGLSLTLVGKLNGVLGWNIWLVVVLAVLAGALVGLANAFFIVIADVPSLIATLGMSTLLAGVTYGISNVTVAGLDETFVGLGQHRFLSIPLPFYYCLLIALASWYVLRWTPFGRHLYFVGSGREVARLSGIRVGRVRTLALVASAALSALAGVLLASSLGATGPSIGATYLLPAFAAVFLGATTIAPGHLNVWGAVVAVYFLITGITGLQLLGAESYIQQIFYGGILLAAVAVSRQAKGRT